MDILEALVPSVGVGILFVVAIRAVVRADRNERAAAASVGKDHEESEES